MTHVSSKLTIMLAYVFRIYSKFSSKKMQELSEAGLINFLLLFLVVARQVELEDVASRACELLGFLPSNCPTGHRTLAWRGQLSLLLLFQVRWFSIIFHHCDLRLFFIFSIFFFPGEGSGCWCTG